ncbi:MAG: hypothetical protein N2110_00970 [Flavobacteriales bacterium]|nr:hypothetical protein [Flavobacteriales bacterium]MCX7767583.1 hypothetical protein [Flavobacteriales bacterium]MDW8410246.1 hypothetical protein [Flavobacteriales bacterium]
MDSALYFGAARGVSALLSPVSLPLLGVVTILAWGETAEIHIARKYHFWLLLLTTSVFTLVFPMLLISAARLMGLIGSVHLHKPSERPFMYFAGIVLMLFFCRYLMQVPLLSPLFPASALGGAAVLACCMVFNFGFKISAHGASCGALFALFFMAGHVLQSDFSLPMVFAAIIGGVVGSARLLLGAHTPVQYYVGWLAGLSAQILGMVGYYRFLVMG